MNYKYINNTYANLNFVSIILTCFNKKLYIRIYQLFLLYEAFHIHFDHILPQFIISSR